MAEGRLPSRPPSQSSSCPRDPPHPNRAGCLTSPRDCFDSLQQRTAPGDPRQAPQQEQPDSLSWLLGGITFPLRGPAACSRQLCLGLRLLPQFQCSVRENRRFPLPERQPQPPEFLHRAKSLADGVMGAGTKSLLKPLCSERWRLCRIAARPRSPLAPPPLRPSLTLPLQRPASVRPIEAHTPGPSTPSPPESLRGGPRLPQPPAPLPRPGVPIQPRAPEAESARVPASHRGWEAPK